MPDTSARRTNSVLRVLVAATVLGVIAMNVLASALPFFGRGTGEVSAIFPTLVKPAGYVFAIWGVVHLGLIAYSVAQFLSPARHRPAYPSALERWAARAPLGVYPGLISIATIANISSAPYAANWSRNSDLRSKPASSGVAERPPQASRTHEKRSATSARSPAGSARA